MSAYSGAGRLKPREDSGAAADKAVEGVALQLRRRRAASWRCEPLADGRRDPLDPMPSDREVLRHVWRTLARHGLLTAAMRSELTRLASHRREVA